MPRFDFVASHIYIRFCFAPYHSSFTLQRLYLKQSKARTFKIFLNQRTFLKFIMFYPGCGASILLRMPSISVIRSASGLLFNAKQDKIFSTKNMSITFPMPAFLSNDRVEK